MSATREQIMQALFALLSGAATFKTAERRLKLWKNVPKPERPALFLAEQGETFTRQSPNLPPKRTLTARAFVYTDAEEAPDAPASLLNDILDAMEAALAPSPVTGVLNLGGLVTHCMIDGEVLKEPGDLDGDGLVVVPIKIFLP